MDEDNTWKSRLNTPKQNANTVVKYSPRHTTAKPTAAQNADKKDTKKKTTTDGENGTTKTKKTYTNDN